LKALLWHLDFFSSSFKPSAVPFTRELTLA
jgi:hypothetical protein